jgi:methionyl-tRNA formyltransferase
MIVEIVLTNPEAIPQDGEIVLFERRTPQQSNIENLNTLSDVYDHIRMLDAKGYPAAYLSTPRHNYSFTDAQRDGDELVATVRISMVDAL